MNIFSICVYYIFSSSTLVDCQQEKHTANSISTSTTLYLQGFIGRHLRTWHNLCREFIPHYFEMSLFLYVINYANCPVYTNVTTDTVWYLNVLNLEHCAFSHPNCLTTPVSWQGWPHQNFVRTTGAETSLRTYSAILTRSLMWQTDRKTDRQNGWLHCISAAILQLLNISVQQERHWVILLY